MTPIKTVLRNRLSDHVDLLLGKLIILEGRNADDIVEAVGLFEKWAAKAEGYDDRFDLTYLLEMYVESCVEWADYPERFREDFPAKSETTWELPEFHLIGALFFADKAFSKFCSKHRDDKHLVPMLYADSVELHQQWCATRGPGKSRNPDRYFVKIESVLRSMDMRSEISSRARHGALKRLEKDPKQEAKSLTKKFWLEWKAGKHPNIRTVERFATEAMRRTPILESANVIRRWSAAWSRESKQERL